MRKITSTICWAILIAFSTNLTAQNLDIDGAAKISDMVINNSADSLVVQQADGTLAIRKIETILNQPIIDPMVIGSVDLGAFNFPNNISVSGRYAFIADIGSDDLKIIDISNPTAPTIVSSLALGDFPISLCVSGRYAYVTGGYDNDLKIIDISNPTAPSIISGVNLNTYTEGVYVSGRYAYVGTEEAGSYDLKIIDISNPTAPSIVSSTALTHPIREVYISGRYAYVQSKSLPAKLSIVDIADPTAPSVLSTLDLVGGGSGLSVSGRYAYVITSGFEKELKIIDIADPTAPSIISRVSFSGNPETLFVSGRYAYVATANLELKIIDIADPTAPDIVGTLALNQGRGIYVSGRYVYITHKTGNPGFLKIIDIAGGEFSGAIAHSLEAGNLQVRNDIIAQGQLQVNGGITAGVGGIFSDGDLGIAGSARIGSESFTVDAINDRVGIGISKPLNRLHLLGDGQLNVLHQASGQSSAVRNFSNSNYFGFLEVPDTSNLFTIDQGFDFGHSSNTFEPYNDDQVSLGNSSYKWTEVWATNGMIQTSDAQLKEHIEDLDYGVSEIMKLRPVSYNWKENPSPNNHLGFLAQDVEGIIPEVVVPASEKEHFDTEKVQGIKAHSSKAQYGMKYAELIPVLTKAIQEQQQEIEQLKSYMEELESLVQKLMVERKDD